MNLVGKESGAPSVDRRPMHLLSESQHIRLVASVVSPVAVLILWQFVYSVGIFSPSLLPGPAKTAMAMLSLFMRVELFYHISATLYRMGCGFLSAAVVGVLLGLMMGMFRPVYYAAMPAVDFVRSIPVTSLYPAFVLVLGIEDASKIGMIFAGSVFVVALNCAYGVLHSSEIRRQMAHLYGATYSQVIWYVVLPEALPQSLIGMRVAMSYSLVVAVLCEMFMGSRYGLGQRLMDAYTTYSIDEMYAIIVVTGFVGLILNHFFARVERALVPWTRQ